MIIPSTEPTPDEIRLAEYGIPLKDEERKNFGFYALIDYKIARETLERLDSAEIRHEFIQRIASLFETAVLENNARLLTKEQKDFIQKYIAEAENKTNNSGHELSGEIKEFDEFLGSI